MRDAKMIRHRWYVEVPTASAVGLALAAAPLTWWAVGPLGANLEDHDYGPYTFSASLLYAIGGLAAALALASIALATSPYGRHMTSRVSALTALLLLLPGILLAVSWRINTAGSDGANIGSGFVLLLTPALVAMFLAGAVKAEGEHRRLSLRRQRALVGLALFTAPLLWAVVWFVLDSTGWCRLVLVWPHRV